jgi:hypothetical protein
MYSFINFECWQCTNLGVETCTHKLAQPSTRTSTTYPLLEHASLLLNETLVLLMRLVPVTLFLLRPQLLRQLLQDDS